jgi:type IV secretory pathway VirB2 component (pilin)
MTQLFSDTLADPLGSSPLVAAVDWLEHTLIGTVATTVAIVAVAWVGVLMLSGRVNLRYAVTVIMGCFVLFGASSIAAGIRSATTSLEGATSEQLQPAPAASAGVVLPSPPDPNYDPYAGASIPTRRSRR